MRNNSMTPYDIFVKKLDGLMGKTLLRDDIARIWMSAGGSKVRLAYGLSKAKNQNHIRTLGGGIYQVSSEGENALGHPISDQYWNVVALLVREHVPSGAVIAHEKSMELSLRNFEIPDVLVLYTRDTAKRIQIGNYQFHFRTIQSGKKTKGRNMFQYFMEHATVIGIDGHTFHTLSIEATLLDVASLKKHDEGISEELIIKSIKKYENSYSRKLLGELVSFRYIRAMNRIRSIAKNHGFQTLYTMSLDIIKKEGGGCYLHL